MRQSNLIALFPKITNLEMTFLKGFMHANHRGVFNAF